MASETTDGHLRDTLPGSWLNDETIRQLLREGLAARLRGSADYGLADHSLKVLALVPDHTRTAPLRRLARLLEEALVEVKQLDYLVALGTHPPLSRSQIEGLLGHRRGQVFQHAWDDPQALAQIGLIPEEQVRQICGAAWHPTLGGDVPVRVNRLALEYDHVLVLGPTFPHEVVGFSGGAKYFFPGISGPEMINATHWLGALVGVVGTIGIADTPVRRMIQAAAQFLPVETSLAAFVVESPGNQAELAGMFIGDLKGWEAGSAWRAAADLSAQRHIRWCERPYRKVLSCAPPMYDELWTAAKAMYKLEAVIADGGELILYAPHLRTISHVHGKYIYEIGYHVLEYFLKQWARFEHIPKGVLAHSTHVRGAGRFEDGVETPRVQVTLASQVPEAECQRLNLGYCDPASINPAEWQGREEEGLLYVPKAGEILYRLKNKSAVKVKTQNRMTTEP